VETIKRQTRAAYGWLVVGHCVGTGFTLYASSGSNSTWLDSTRRHIRRVEPMHFGCVELVEQHSSTRSTRRARLARQALLAT